MDRAGYCTKFELGGYISMDLKSAKNPSDKEINKAIEYPLPIYPDNEDIYRKEKKAKDINPDDNSEVSGEIIKDTERNEKGFEDDVSGGDLDIPGAELDDPDEAIGEEDEENNYYSLGGDDHNDLEEEKE
jgi:hypothetical protein